MLRFQRDASPQHTSEPLAHETEIREPRAPAAGLQTRGLTSRSADTPPPLLLICSPGGEADQLRAVSCSPPYVLSIKVFAPNYIGKCTSYLPFGVSGACYQMAPQVLLAGVRHATGVLTLTGVVACGGAAGEALERAKLVRAALSLLGLGGAVPVGIAVDSSLPLSSLAPWETRLSGFGDVAESELLPAQLLMRQCLRNARTRELTIVCCCTLSPIATLLVGSP